jgi:hypothetical protein
MTRKSCDTIRPLISAALDGDLDEHEFVQLSEHLAVCPECRKVNEDYSMLRNGLRSSPPPAPPPDLARSVRRETVEKPPPPFIIQLASRTGVRWGMSTMAASVVGLLAAVLFLAHGIDQRTVPVIASSHPDQESTQNWPISSPIEIEFSKQMDQRSVEENLIIWPSSEQDRLPTSWSGNTLTIGRSDERSVLLLPETDYRITILEHAQDRHGNPIGDFWMLQFRTGPPDVAISTPTPNDEVSSSATSEITQLDRSEWAFSQSDDDDTVDDEPASTPSSNGSGNGQSSAEASEANESSADPDESGSDSGTSSSGNTSDSGSSDPEATQPPAQPTAEPEPTRPRATPEPEPTATPRPDPTPTATPEPTTPPAEPTPTPEPPGVRGAFGEVYWSNDGVQQALGGPMHDALAFLGSQQEFQRGFMFRQYHQDRNSVFVFVNGGRVQILNNDYDANRDSFPSAEKGDGVYQPGGAFGKIWSERADLQQDLGFSLTASPVENVDAVIQQFDRGTMLFSRGNVYVIYSDLSWDVFTVRSGSNGGYQGGNPDQEADRPEEGGDSGSDGAADVEQEIDPEAGQDDQQGDSDDTTPGHDEDS